MSMLSRRAVLLPAFALVLLLATPVFGASIPIPFHGKKRVEYIRPIEHSEPAEGLQTVVLQNLVGPISIETNDTDNVKVQVIIHAAGPDETFARTLADQLTFALDRVENQFRVVGNYPVDHFTNYAYPHMKSMLGIHGTDTNEYQGHKVHIRNAGNSKSVELWAEIRLALPSSVGVTVRNIYGDVEVRGDGKAGEALFDGFTDVGDFAIYNPRWSNLKLESDYGKVSFMRGFGAAKDIHVNTDFGGTYFYLLPGASGKILARKDLGFLHNNFTDARFDKEGDDHVMILGDGNGTVVHVDMNVGSLHLERGIG